MTPKMKATLDEEIREAARKLFLSSSVADSRQSLQPERRISGTAS